MSSTNLRVVGLAVAMTAVAACGGSPKAQSNAASAQAGLVYSAKATSASEKALGITRWHSIVEKKPTSALLVDGQDAKGRVKFIASVHVDGKKQLLYVQTHLPQKGELVWNLKTHAIVSNTVPKGAVAYTRALSTDWRAAHPAHGDVAYSYYSDFEIAVGAVQTVVGVVEIVTAPEDGGALVESGIDNISGGLDKIASGVEDMEQENNNDNQSASDISQGADQVSTGSSGPEQTDTNGAIVNEPTQTDSNGAIVNGDGTSQGAQGSDMTGDGTVTGTQGSAADPNAPDPSGTNESTTTSDQSTDLPSDDGGGNLDDVGGGDTMTGSSGTDPTTTGDDGSDSLGGGDMGGGDPGGGGDFSGGGGDFGGGGADGDFAANVCRRVAISKTSGVRACVSY